MMEWIKCSDRMPEIAEWVIIVFEKSDIQIGALNSANKGYRWFSRGVGMLIDNPTHWMPLPEPPKEGEA
jgi:hypothetical protein